MALQGTIDAFPLTDVLHLLSSSKTGCLVLEGDRGRATLWIEDGQVVGGGPATTPAPDPETLVFEMLRFRAGSFVFDAGEGLDGPEVVVSPTPLPDCVEAAESLIEQWSEIEAVVPSLAHRVGLVPALGHEEVTIAAHDWPLVHAAGRVPTLGELVAAVGMGEYDGAAAVANLVLAGLLEVSEPEPVGPSNPVTEADSPSTSGVSPRPAQLDEPSAAFPDRFPIDDLMGTAEQGSEDTWVAEPPASVPAAHSDDAWDQLLDETLQPDASPAADAAARDDGDADEVLRQMARLSPQAAEAVAAALKPEHRDAEDGTGGANPYYGAL